MSWITAVVMETYPLLGEKFAKKAESFCVVKNISWCINSIVIVTALFPIVWNRSQEWSETRRNNPNFLEPMSPTEITAVDKKTWSFFSKTLNIDPPYITREGEVWSVFLVRTKSDLHLIFVIVVWHVLSWYNGFWMYYDYSNILDWDHKFYQNRSWLMFGYLSRNTWQILGTIFFFTFRSELFRIFVYQDVKQNKYKAFSQSTHRC